MHGEGWTLDISNHVADPTETHCIFRMLLPQTHERIDKDVRCIRYLKSSDAAKPDAAR